MCKMDLKDAYFSVPLDQNSRKFVRFQRKGTLYEFRAPRAFTKVIEIPIFLLRKINIKVIIYLDDKLILSHTIREAHMSQDTDMYLLQNFGFIINIKKSMEMTLSLTLEKLQKISRPL